MKFITKITLLIFISGVYSCHSGSKKIKAYTTHVMAHQQADSTKTDSAINNNLSLGVRDTSQPLITKVIFSDFSVKVNNSAFENFSNNNIEFTYSGDKIDVRNYRMWTITPKTDTVFLNTDDGMGLDIGKIEILPNNKSDKFEISYSFKLQIVAENEKDGILWESMMPYKKIKDSLNYFFSTPEHNNMYSEMGLKIKEIKKKLNLKDTAFKKEAANSDYGIYTEDGVIFKNQLCKIPYIELIYLKIDRFIENKLAETKYLVIDFSNPE